MSKHTPGPWVASGSVPEEGVNCYWIFGRDENGTHREIGCVNGPQGSKTAPDAFLIAAAPDLLRECQKALAAWTGEGPPIILDDLRAAIARATGEPR